MAKGKTKDVTTEFRESTTKIWQAGLGAFATAEQEGGKLFRTLVEKGKEFEKMGRVEAKGLRDRAGKVADDARERASNVVGQVGDVLDESVAKALHRVGVPTRDEIAKLTRRVEQLTELVEQRLPGRGARSGARRKTPSSKG